MTKFDPDLHHRRSIRLPGCDYSQSGAYLVTICTAHKRCILGDVFDNEMVLSTVGCVVDKCWRAIPKHFPHAEYEHLIRSEADLNRIRLYIHHNPAQWVLDSENPSNLHS